MWRVVLALVLVGGLAHAEKRRSTAQILSGVGTGASSALVLSAFAVTDKRDPVNMPLLYTGLATSLVTPSLGQIYVGDYITPGMGVRALAVGVAVFAVEHEQRTVDCAGSFGQCQELSGNAVVLLGLAAIAYIGGTAYDVADAADAVDRYNQRHGVLVTPTALAGPGGLAPGLAIGGRW
jgi:hypothetical protein